MQDELLEKMAQTLTTVVENQKKMEATIKELQGGRDNPENNQEDDSDLELTKKDIYRIVNG